MKRDSIITIIIIIAVLVLAYAVIAFPNKNPETDEEIVKCISENSVLYIQLGCSACKSQEELFGENYKNLNVVDCFYEREECVGNIEYTPTWVINGEKIVGVQSIEKLREATGC